jgi:hypothetical protein
MCGVGVSGFKFPCGILCAASAVLMLLLAGCSSLPSMPSMSMPSMPDWFTSAGSNANASAAPGAPGLPANFECPPVQVRTGAATLTDSANPGEPTATNLRYQVTVTTTARECRLGPGNTVMMKVGMQGRVILGPEGGTVSAVTVPIRFAVVRETVETKVLTTKLDRVPVTIPPNDSNVLFTHVTEGLDFPMPRGNEIDSYLVYIGFDPAGAEPQPKRPAPKAKPKTVKPRPARPAG